MGETSAIEWTDATWNPVRGCTKVSPGCKHCYAETFAERWRGIAGHPYEQGFDLRLAPEQLGAPLKWRKSKRVFVNSMSDLFHEDVPNEYIAAVFGVMAATPRHTYQVLTKRSTRMREWFDWIATQPLLNFDGSVHESLMAVHPWYICALHAEQNGLSVRGLHPPPYPWPLPNVWLGVSAEDQERADERVPDLLESPASVRFVSAEPLLGQIDFDDKRDWLTPAIGKAKDAPRLDWVIVGGESGPKSRPFYAGWARRIVQQCRDTGVACFVKQLGAKPYDRNDAGFEGDEPDNWPMGTDARDVPGDTGYQGAPVLVRLRNRKGNNPAEWPADLRVREWPTP